MQGPDQRFVYQILGRAQPYRDFVIWDDDMFRFLLRLDQQILASKAIGSPFRRVTSLSLA
jgi:hypothetical protein